MSTYQTKQLDEWDLIAFQQLGTEYAAGDLIADNSTLGIVSTEQFDPGIVLNLPSPPLSKPIVGPPPWRNVTTTG